MDDDPVEVSTSTFHQSQGNQAKPTVACLRCRDQKLRCDRELPVCERCRKQKAACMYPSPPDRKRIAQRTNRAKAQQPTREEEAPRSASFSSTPVNPAKRQRVAEKQTLLKDSPPLNETGSAELPSTEVGLLLLEVYFKRIYNATLLFHKTIAFQLYMQNGIPDYLLRAIFAHAAVFLKEVEEPSHRKNIKIFPMQTLYEKSWPWARSASVEALGHADEPSLIRIQALQVLQFYYFSQGEIKRAIVHASLAYRLSQLLGYDKLYEEVASPTDRGMQFDREMRRRSFWASWCSSIIGSDGLNPSQVFERVANLPLPARFDKGGSIQRILITQGETMDQNWKSSTEAGADRGSTVSLMAELVNILGVWIKVQAFISSASTRSIAQRRNDIKSLDELFDPIERSMQIPITNLCSRAEAYDDSPELLASVCTLLHLSRLLMHASMVPILSGHPLQSTSRESTQDHIKIVLQQANEYVKILQQFAKHDLDLTRLWPISGYGAFMVGDVLVVFNNVSRSAWSTDESMQVPCIISEEMKTVQMALDVLSIYWQPLRKLATKLNAAVSAGQSSGVSLVTSSAYPGYSLNEHGDSINARSSTSLNNPILRTPYFDISTPGQQEPEYRTRQEHNQPLVEQRTHAQARTAPEPTGTQAPESSYDFASFHYPPVNGHREGIFDAGWWNNEPAIDGWVYPVAENPGRGVVP